ncbi:gamma-glutamyltransferase family protein [Rhizobium sp. SSA_523]|uniref:gamma-glutamyltransferase family protein n=1 Tax=Rhizobium sp. SSA_523 TaxID=2952477 RepID=UPI0020910909|nr:gamma-glutamyltransferase [Rhizobium sp. SSA_523]MCO5733321.1 gamma-glutamyltransferase [Rhizobium sp. SSA_523]WKC21698.1 gamma-glutamyltransferase [Rhizobium sp. SSA_523]
MSTSLAVSPHPQATDIGNRLLAEGRCAAEAAVAMGAHLSVAMPHFCGIGGDAVWMLADAGGHVRALSGIGRAFAFSDQVTRIATRGPGSILTTCGAVATWITALEASGRSDTDIAALLQPAISAARDGIIVTASQDFWREKRDAEMSGWPGFSNFADARCGSKLIQPELGESLEILAREGLRSFYEGSLAARILADLHMLGVDATAADLASLDCLNEAPLSLAYRDSVLHAPPPPTQGVTTLEIMGILERLAPPKSRADEVHLMVEAVKRAFLDRRLIDDGPEAMALAKAFLSDTHLVRQSEAVDPARAAPWPQVFQEADTVYFAARDKNGNCVSALQSTYFDWGSGCRLGRTGIIWHNRGAGFSLGSGRNRLASGRRPFHTLNPGIATRNGVPWLLYGTQGADGQPQTLTVLLRQAIDHKLMPKEALAAPRFLLGKTFSDSGESLKIEVSGIEDELAALGHQISPLPTLSPLAGQAGMIRIEGDTVIGAHDPRH